MAIPEESPSSLLHLCPVSSAQGSRGRKDPSSWGKDPRMGFFIISIPEKGTGLLSGAISALGWDVCLRCPGWEQGLGRGTLRPAGCLCRVLNCLENSVENTK